MIDFSRINSSKNNLQIEPRDIFMSLPSRSKNYEYPRDVQTEVWKQWYDSRNKENCIIKMNTGSGKTVVGLIILKSCLNEGKGPAVYVVPDKYLVNQVRMEAKRLGIDTTDNPEDISFARKQSILVTNIYTLVNGKSRFGMRNEYNINIGSVIIDDVHACLDTIEAQYTVKIPSTDTVYSDLIKLFSDSLKSQSENDYSDIADKSDPLAYMLVPYWCWQSKQTEIYNILQQSADSDYMQFNFKLIKDNLALCNCMVSGSGIEITLPCIPINKISSFVNAERKIFMSATLADDSAFINALNIEAEDIEKIISPEKANDIGDRLILFPQAMNKKISDTNIKEKLKTLSSKYNIVVIVPSKHRAEFWNDVSDMNIDSQNIDNSILRLKSEHVGLAVLLNKYDGIDLPDDACRILVIDGLPKMRSKYDSFEQNANPKSKRLCSEQIQKIEQGMGRGVRSNTDYCIIILMGRELADVVYTADGYNYFSDATKAQYELSENIWKQLDEPTIDEIIELSDYSLKRDTNWITVSKDALSNINYSTLPNFNNVSIAQRKAFNLAEVGRYDEAVAVLEELRNVTSEKNLRGLLKQYIAQYENFYNPEKAQQTQLSAYTDNRIVLRPLQGIQFEKVLNRTGSQAQFLIKNIAENEITPNEYILKIHALLEKLSFIPETAKIFESALKDISFLIGIYSNRPETEYGKGPDNFWDIGNSEYLVIECKNGTTSDTICKHDCNQLNGSINWFDHHYHSDSCICYPIMIHNSKLFEFSCSPSEKIRIMTPALLERFKKNILLFAENVVKANNYNNAIAINKLLNQFNLSGKQIVDKFTTTFNICKK